MLLTVESGSLSTPVILEDKFTNVFVVQDKACGPICPTCQSETVIVFKKNLFSSIMNESVFLPSFKNYIRERVIPLSERFINEWPVPINPQTDKWMCLRCREVRPFKYDKILGLRYH